MKYTYDERFKTLITKGFFGIMFRLGNKKIGFTVGGCFEDYNK